MDIIPELSAVLNDKINIVTSDNSSPVTYELTMNILSPNRKDISFKVDKIERYDIDRSYLLHYMDNRDIDFQLTRQQYIQIAKFPENLQCVLTFKKYHLGKQKITETISTEQYMLILRDKRDMYKRFSEKQLRAQSVDYEYEGQTNQSVYCSAQLVTALEYKVRRTRFNFILRGCTIKQVIQYLCNKMGIRKLRLVEPDNKKVYTNFIVEPMLDISNVFSWLQNSNGKGVYNKGLSYYLLNDTLYVYPPFETNLTSKMSIDFYRIPRVLPSEFTCMSYKNNNLIVLLQSPPMDTNNVDADIENTHNTALVHHLDTIIPNSYNTPEGFKYNVFESNTTTAVLDSKKGMTSDVYNPRYVRSHDNVFRIHSDLWGNELLTMTIVANHIHPTLLKPADKITYHYDGDGRQMHRIPGQCTRCVFSFTRPDNDIPTDLFIISNTIGVYLENKVIMEETPITISSDKIEKA